MDAYWSADGRELYWTYASKFYSIDSKKLQKLIHLGDRNLSSTYFDKIDINLKVPGIYGKGLLALTNARIITMKGNQIIRNGSILIANGRIVKVGNTNTIKIPISTKRIDLNGATIIPGFIDLHSHARLPQEVFPQQYWGYLANLAWGVTSLRDPSENFDSFGIAELLKTGGMEGPRLFTVGRAVNPIMSIIPKTLNEALSIVAKRKIMGGISVKQYCQSTRLQREYLLLAL